MTTTAAGCVSLRLPFGIQVSGASSATPGLTFDPMRALLVNLNGVLAPFMPIFKIVGFAKDVTDAIKAIPDCITNLNPSPLVQKLVKVAADVEELLEVLPQASVPVMLRDLVGLLIVYLEGVRSQLQGLEIQARVAVSLMATAAPLQTTNPDAYAELTGIAGACVTDGTDVMTALDAQSCPYNALAKTIAAVADLIGLPAPPLLPCFNVSANLSPSAYNAALETAISALDLALSVLEALGSALGGATAPLPPC
jgi:hypothetical protein